MGPNGRILINKVIGLMEFVDVPICEEFDENNAGIGIVAGGSDDGG
jgi:hypothetical protein